MKFYLSRTFFFTSNTDLLMDSFRSVQESPVVVGEVKERILMDIQYQLANIDEYVACQVSALTTRIMDARASTDDFTFQKIVEAEIPECMRTPEVVDYCMGLKREICQTKYYEPYDMYHQKLYHLFGFSHELPTFSEIHRLDDERKKNRGFRWCFCS